MDWQDRGWYMHDGMGWGMGYGMGWGGWLLLLLGFLVVVALGVAVVVLLLRGAGTSQHPVGPSGGPGRPGAPGGPEAGADRILDERFARGEIDEEEYRARRAVLHTQ